MSKARGTGPRASNVVASLREVGDGSIGEIALAKQLDIKGIHYEREVKLIPDRLHRVDFLIKAGKGKLKRLVVVEIEGGVWSRGRHLRGQGWLDDAWKYNMLTAMGYYVYRFATHQVVIEKTGELVTEAMDWLFDTGVLP